MSTATSPQLTSMQRRVSERLQDRSKTSGEQASAATHAGDTFLSACPGAGKTYTVGLRLAYHAAFHRDLSVAAMSHTNTAKHAIRAAAARLAALPDHYVVDTLHSFLLRYVVYPFGHLVMDCSEVPQIVGEDREWPSDIRDIGAPDYAGMRVKPWRLEIFADGELHYPIPADWPNTLTSAAIVDAVGDWLAQEKLAYWKRGLLSYDDALWVAREVLRDHKPLAQAVAARFDELIVDEVQDTGQLQLACLALLREQDDPPALVIVGDLCQAVYEWSGTTPDGLRTFAEDQGLTELSLTANFRSSARICAVTHHFSTRRDPDRAAGSNADAAEPPWLWRYQTGRETEVVERFRGRLTDTGVAEVNAAVLAWTHSLVRRLNGETGASGPPMHWLLRLLGEAAVERDDRAGPRHDTFQGLDRALLYIAYGTARPAALSYREREAIRPLSGELLRALPKVEGDLRDWNLQARCLLDEMASELKDDEPALKVNRYLRDALPLRGVDARQAFEPPPPRLARTIHDAKGENIEAVMVVARQEDATEWADEAWTDEPPESTTERLRIAYVALTRAERLLVLAVPDATPTDAIERFRQVGFSEAA